MLGNKTNNQRRGPDTLTKAIGIFAGISWLLILIAFILYVTSKPREASIYDMRFGVVSSYKGDPSLFMFVNIVLVLVTIVCSIGFII